MALRIFRLHFREGAQRTQRKQRQTLPVIHGQPGQVGKAKPNGILRNGRRDRNGKGVRFAIWIVRFSPHQTNLGFPPHQAKSMPDGDPGFAGGPGSRLRRSLTMTSRCAPIPSTPPSQKTGSSGTPASGAQLFSAQERDFGQWPSS